MSSYPYIRKEIPLLLHGGRVWNRLHSEREEICSALLDGGGSPSDTSKVRIPEGKNRERLEARLRKLDDALDRLIAGSYGDCNQCGRWIEDSRLAADPTVAYCVECDPRPTEPVKRKYHITSLDHTKVWRSFKERNSQWRP